MYVGSEFRAVSCCLFTARCPPREEGGREIPSEETCKYSNALDRLVKRQGGEHGDYLRVLLISGTSLIRGQETSHMTVSAMMGQEAECRKSPPPKSSFPTSMTGEQPQFSNGTHRSLYYRTEVNSIHFQKLFTSFLLKSSNSFILIRQRVFSFSLSNTFAPVVL